MEIKIVVPTHKRPERVLTKKAVSDVILCVAESQKEAYYFHNADCEIVTHPDSVIGLLPKRNWIYKHFGNVMMLDDDIKAMHRLYTEPKEPHIVPPEIARKIIEQTADNCQQIGAYLFGFNTAPNPLMFKANEPIELTGYVTGCAQGLLKGSGLWYNENIILNCDYWISLLNAYHHRMVYKDMRFYLAQKDTFVGAGGLAEFRNLEAEESDFNLLKKYFGDAVQFKKDMGKVKRKHPFQKTICLPF